MTASRFIGYITGFGLLAVVAAFSANYIIDPHSVFGTKFFPDYAQLQERYLKIEFLKFHSNFNTVLIGNSKSGVVKTETIDNYFSGAKAYNFTIFKADQRDVEQHVEWLVKNIPSLSHVIVQVDWIAPPDKSGLALLRELHPDISGRSQYAFLLDYLTKVNLRAMGKKIENNNGNAGWLKYDITKGYWSWPQADKKIDEDCKNYITNEEPAFGESYRPVKIETSALTSSLASIARYKKRLDEKHVKLTVFLTPQNHHSLDTIDIDNYAVFIRQLANITEFRNFMYYNKLTKNDCDYYDVLHYRPHVGELVVRLLAEQQNSQSGLYQNVSKESVDSHVNFLRTNFMYERSHRL